MSTYRANPHPHSHAPSNCEFADAPVRRIRLAFWLNLGFSVVERVGGLLSGSVAIIADAVHDLGDSVSLGFALAAQQLSGRDANARYSYGYQRLSVFSAVFTATVLMTGSVYVVIESIERFAEPRTPDGLMMLGFAIFGLAVNGYAAWRLSAGGTLNEKVLTWHLLEDVLGWAAVLLGSIAILLFDWAWVDPLLAVGIAAFILVSVFGNLKQSAVEEIEREIEAHDFHAWSLDDEHHVLTVHGVVEPGASALDVR